MFEAFLQEILIDKIRLGSRLSKEKTPSPKQSNVLNHKSQKQDHESKPESQADTCTGSGLTSQVRRQVHTHQPMSLTAIFHPSGREVSMTICLCGLFQMTLNY